MAGILILVILGGGSDNYYLSIKTNLSSNVSFNAVQQTALEPVFAPGILFNSIKSGIAVDWPCLTRFKFFNRTRYFKSFS